MGCPRDLDLDMESDWESLHNPPPEIFAATLGCCGEPKLETVRAVYDASHDMESIRKCRCGAAFYHRWMEHVSFTDGDTVVEWYSPMEEHEAGRLREQEHIDTPDLRFLTWRAETIFVCETFVSFVHGQPDLPLWLPAGPGRMRGSGVNYSFWYPPPAADARRQPVGSTERERIAWRNFNRTWAALCTIERDFNLSIHWWTGAPVEEALVTRARYEADGRLHWDDERDTVIHEVLLRLMHAAGDYLRQPEPGAPFHLQPFEAEFARLDKVEHELGSNEGLRLHIAERAFDKLAHQFGFWSRRSSVRAKVLAAFRNFERAKRAH